MGRKTRPFIDKKNATTYTLTWNDDSSESGSDGGEDSEAPAALPLPSSAAAASGGRGGGGGDISAWIAGDAVSEYGSEWGCNPAPSDLGDYVLSEARRREIIEYGFPDDGYDYLKHTRELAPRRATDIVGGRKPVQRVTVRDTCKAPLPGGDGASSSLAAAGDEDGDGDQGAGSDGGGEESDAGAAAAGPSVFVRGAFVPPKEDTCLVDARQYKLAARAPADDDEIADAALMNVSAFARATKRPTGHRGRMAHELEELDAVMRMLEEEEDGAQPAPPRKAGRESSLRAKLRAVDGATVEARKIVEMHKGLGEDPDDDAEDWDDWFDGFVAKAAAADDQCSSHAGDADADIDAELCAVQGRGQVGPPGSVAGGRAAGVAHSFASSYWRDERTDRRGELSGLDDRFEVLATQYEDEEVGLLEPEDEEEGLPAGAGGGDAASVLTLGGEAAAKARNGAKLADFAGLLDEFLAEQAEMEKAYDAADTRMRTSGGADVDADRGGAVGVPELAGMRPLQGHLCRKMEALDVADADVIAKTRARLAAAEARAAAAAAGGDGGGEGGGDPFETATRVVVVERDDRWDCESVLSLRSNTENHPGRISEPQRRPGGRAGGGVGGIIKLSAKTGLPSTVPLRTAAIPEEEGDGADGIDGDGADGASASSSECAGSVVAPERKKGESAEERRARKAAVKAAQREARASKKALKTMFKDESSRQKKAAAGRNATAGAGSTFSIA